MQYSGVATKFGYIRCQFLYLGFYILSEVSDIQGRIKPSQDRAGPLVETANEWNDVHHLPHLLNGYSIIKSGQQTNLQPFSLTNFQDHRTSGSGDI